MSFTSCTFFAFISIFFLLWTQFKTARARFSLLSISSLLFYAVASPYYVLLFITSCGIAYVASHKIHDDRANARKWLILGVGADLAILCFFKYLNLLLETTSGLLHVVGWRSSIPTLGIALPIGISFYTFQSISHTVDTYRGEIVPAKSFRKFLLFESYFPHLVAGPIQQANFLIPQVERFFEGKLPNSREKVFEGIELILRGYVKKLLVADNLALYVDKVFDHPDSYRFYTLASATFLFSIQIYCDFSGYTDIARGLAKTMGFEFSLNFDYPYLSRSIVDFWRRWHISLSSWLRNYLYIPLGGSRGSKLFKYRNLMLTMALGGLWHGASYTFLIWGIYQGSLLVINHEWSERSRGQGG